jgi:hypothetical protein
MGTSLLRVSVLLAAAAFSVSTGQNAAGPDFTTENPKRAISKLPDPAFLDGEAKQILEAVGERW